MPGKRYPTPIKMNSFLEPAQRISRRVALVALVLIGLSEAAANVGNGGDLVVAVSSLSASTYHRVRLSDGTFKTETIVFGDGGLIAGGENDPSIDKTDFMHVAHTLAAPLARQGYLSSTDPRHTDLLIMVYWGATHPPSNPGSSAGMQEMQMASESMAAANTGANAVNYDIGSRGWAEPAMYSQSVSGSGSIRTASQAMADDAMTSAMAMVAGENQIRDQIDARNAALLGYDSWWSETAAFKGTPFDFRRQDMMNELEERRYFVVLMAYDFQAMLKHKKRELLWETRYSVRERGNDFKSSLAAMTRTAAAYFGRDSDGLRHQPLVGHVNFGPERLIRYEAR